MRYFLLTSFAFLQALFMHVSAQSTDCIDPSAASPTYPCLSTDYYPVCGCNNVTYRNACEAQFRNGVRTWTDGPCSGFEFDILPNAVTSGTNFTFVQTNPRYARLVIMDAFGKIWYQIQLEPLQRINFTLDTVTFGYGVYYVLVYDAKGTYRYKSFVKVSD